MKDKLIQQEKVMVVVMSDQEEKLNDQKKVTPWQKDNYEAEGGKLEHRTKSLEEQLQKQLNDQRPKEESWKMEQSKLEESMRNLSKKSLKKSLRDEGLKMYNIGTILELNKLSDDLKKSKEVMLEQLDSKEKIIKENEGRVMLSILHDKETSIQKLNEDFSKLDEDLDNHEKDNANLLEQTSCQR
ncbi:hypothetical protein YC2023_107788 [Brassica napus]